VGLEAQPSHVWPTTSMYCINQFMGEVRIARYLVLLQKIKYMIFYFCVRPCKINAKLNGKVFILWAICISVFISSDHHKDTYSATFITDECALQTLVNEHVLSCVDLFVSHLYWHLKLGLHTETGVYIRLQVVTSGHRRLQTVPAC